MGCDIHGWVEKKVGDKWIAIEPLKADERNYTRFALLASVRGRGSRVPRGIPDDVSETTRYHIDRWGADGHSHSHMQIQEAAAVFLATDPEPNQYEINCPLGSYFNIEHGDIGQYRLVFWFDD